MDINKMLEDANKIIKQNEKFIKEFDKRQEVVDQYFGFFEKDKSLDAKVKAFKNMPWNKGTNLDEKLVDYFTQTGKEINKENVSSVISAINQINYTNQQHNSKFPLTPENFDKVIAIHKGKNEPNTVKQPQPKKEAIYKQYFKDKDVQPRSQSIPQIYRKDKEIPQEPSVRKSNQSKNNLNNSFTSTLNSSVLSTSSSQSDLNNIQKQNSQKEVQTQSKLEQIKSWFSEKFSNISSFLSNPFSFGQKSEVSTSNITMSNQNNIKPQTKVNNNLQKSNYR